MKFLFLRILPFLLLNAFILNAADTLRLNDAIAIALDKNFNIAIAENNLKISEKGNTVGFAGMLPSVGVSGSRTLAVNNSRQEYFDGRIKEGKNAKTNSNSAGIQLSWTIFDGFNMFIQKERLSELENLSAIQLRSVIENTVFSVINLYYNLVTQQTLIDIYYEAVNNSSERLNYAKSKFELGSGSELAVLQANVDLNADSSVLIKQISVVENLKSELNLILCRDISTAFFVQPLIEVNKSLDFEQLWKNAQSENPEMQKARKDINLANLTLKQLKSQQLPRLNFNSGYNFSKSESELGLLTSNRNLGYNLGLSLSYTLFNGFTNRQQIAQARIRQESAKTVAMQVVLDMEASIRQVFNDYSTNLKLIRFETDNLKLSKRNFAVAEEKYKMGMITDIELRETQVKTLEAENRLLSSIYRCKTAETELYRLTGILSVENK